MKFFKTLSNKIASEVATKRDDSDAIFSLASASIEIGEKLNLNFSGTAALCIKIIDGDLFKNTIKDCTDFLKVSKEEFKFESKTVTDSYGYLWFIIYGSNLMILSDVITNVAAVISSLGETIEENGFAELILSAVFLFKSLKPDLDLQKIISDSNGKKHQDFSRATDNKEIDEADDKNYLYLVYNYKTNKFYPYIPLGNIARDTTRE